MNLKTVSRIRRVIVIFVIFSISGFYLISCSEKPDGADGLVKNIVNAYGGEDGINSIERYRGTGFLKKLPIGNVVKNYPISVFQDKYRYKECIAHVVRGDAVNKWVWINNGEKTTQWTNSDMMLNKPLLENSLIKYRFPVIISSMKQAVKGKKLIDNHEVDRYQLLFIDGDNTVTVTVNGGDWLLNGIEVNNSADSMIYSEQYSTYRKVEGIPIPNRITRSVNGKPYCEVFFPVIEYGLILPDSVFEIAAKDTLIEEAE